MSTANVFNVETSLNNWLSTQIANLTPPAFFSGFPGQRLILTMPEAPANVPAYSMHHLMIDTIDEWQGRRGDGGTTATTYKAFMDISAWASRKNVNWVADMRWMAYALMDIVNKTKTVQVTNYLSDYTNPVATSYRVVIEKMEARQTEMDANPDIERQRFLVKYHFIMRSS